MSLTDEELELLKKLDNELIVSNPPLLTQERFDLIVEFLKQEDKKEKMWRLCGSYDEMGIDFHSVIDYYVLKKDSFYISELVQFVEEIDDDYVATKMIMSGDKNFIRNALNSCGNGMEYKMSGHAIKKLYDYIK